MLRLILILVLLTAYCNFAFARAVIPPSSEGIVSPLGFYVARIVGVDMEPQEAELFLFEEGNYAKHAKYKLINASGAPFKFLSDSGYLVTFGSRQEPDKAVVIYEPSGKVVKTYSIDRFLSNSEKKYISKSMHLGLEEHWFCRTCLLSDEFGFYEGEYFLFYDFFNREHRVYLKNGKHSLTP